MATYTESRRQQPLRLGPVAYGGFPVRSLTIQGTGDGGEWITAYQADQGRRLRAVLSTTMRETESTLKPPANTREVSAGAARRKTMDGLFLMKHCYVEEPSDLCVCNISGEGLQEYKKEDFVLFDNVVHINASDNRLPLEAFETFPALQELELSLNNVIDVGIEQKDFGGLQCLDLSYNSISGVSLLILGTLPSLQELHLTGNNLVALPVEMSRPFALEGTEGTLSKMRFPSLERLWLDDNKLTDQATFATLAGLRKLKYLNLDNNEIYTLPQLKLIGTSPLKTVADGPTSTEPLKTVADRPTSTEPLKTEAGRPTSTEPLKTLAGRPMSTEPLKTVAGRPTSTEPLKTVADRPTSTEPARVVPNEEDSLTNDRAVSSETPQGRSTIESTSTRSSSLLDCHAPPNTTATTQRHSPGWKKVVSVHEEEIVSLSRLTPSMAPFPRLETLSLVNNLILTAEGLLACGSWPALKKLIIHGNPLTRAAKGMPPLLQRHLVEQCGISVIRQKLSSRKRFTIGKAAKEFKKISVASPPTIPRHPLLALEAPPSTNLPTLEYSPSSSSHTLTPTHSLTTASEASCVEGEGDGGSEGHQGVFLTQSPAAEEPVDSSSLQERHHQKPWSAKDEFKVRRKELRQRYRDVPERYRGYEALLDTRDDPSMPIPTDVHSCTRALQHALKHPLILADTRSSQPPKSPGRFLKRRPSTVSRGPQANTKIRDMHNVLDDIRNRCIALETNLDDVLHPKTPPVRSLSSLQRESRQLLAEMQEKYDRVRASSLKMLRTLSEQPSTPTRGRRLSPYRDQSLMSRERTRTLSEQPSTPTRGRRLSPYRDQSLMSRERTRSTSPRLI